jgi:hypothetical protein
MHESLYRGPYGKHSTEPHGVDMVTVRCLAQDRLRSVRQDLDQQNIRSLFAIRVLEEMVRYTASTIHEMCEGVVIVLAYHLGFAFQLILPWNRRWV